jgi:molecular chaperone GrpE
MLSASRGIFYARTVPEQDELMTDAVSNTDDLEPAEGGEIVDDEAAVPTDDSDLQDPPERLAESDAAGMTDDSDAQDSIEGLEASDEDVAAAAADGGDEVLAALAKFDELNDRHLRLAAEFNNFRRRTEQQRLESWARAQADLVEKFLDVLDDLHRVADLDLSNATVEGIMEGIDLVEKKFVRVVADMGMEMIDPAGDAFDPELMEAMMRVPTDDEEEDDVVAQVFQKGYTLKGILVRPARVSVHKHG